jgi:hypothetical protein
MLRIVVEISRLSLVVLGVLAAGPVLATMPPNPERLLTVSNCTEAKHNLKEARLGSPLLSPAKNAKIVQELEAAVKRLCID